MNEMLADIYQADIAQAAAEMLALQIMFLVVKEMKAKFGKDGDAWFYQVGELSEPDSISGFGDTPEQALNDFYKQWQQGTRRRRG